MCTVCGRKPVLREGSYCESAIFRSVHIFLPARHPLCLALLSGLLGGSRGGLLFTLGVPGLQLELIYFSPAQLDRPEILRGRVFRQLGSSPISAPLFIQFIYLGQPSPAPAVSWLVQVFPSSLCEFLVLGTYFLLPFLLSSGQLQVSMLLAQGGSLLFRSPLRVKSGEAPECAGSST